MLIALKLVFGYNSRYTCLVVSILSPDLFSYSFLILANSFKDSMVVHILKETKKRGKNSLKVLVHTCNTATNSAPLVGLNFLFPNFESKRVSSDKADSFPE